MKVLRRRRDFLGGTYVDKSGTYVDFVILAAPMLTGTYVDSGGECNPAPFSTEDDTS